MSKKLVLSSCLVILLVSCTGSKAPRAVPNSANPTATPQPSTTPTLIVTKRADGWKRFTSKEVGVSFWFPPIAGLIEYAFNRCRPPRGDECPGPYYSWNVTRKDLALGNSYWFAGFTGWQSYGRDGWPTDISDWGQDGRGYWVSSGETTRDRTHVFAVEKLRTRDGSRALVFKPGAFSLGSECGELGCANQKDRAVIIRFMRSRGGFRSLVFYFRDRTPLTEIEEAVHSVRFSS